MREVRTLLYLLFFYRCAMSVAGQLVVTKLSSLGDSSKWQLRGWSFDDGWWLSANLITANVGAFFFSLIGGPTIAVGPRICVNLGFQALAFYGIYYFVSALEPRLRKRAIFLFFFPTLSLWSSVAGKEALLVFAMGVICGYLIRIYSRTEHFSLVLIFAFYLVLVIKTHYVIALLYIFGAAKLCRALPNPGLIILILSIGTLAPLYYFRNIIDALSFQILPHFMGTRGASTREAFWIDKFDVFWKAPYGMVQAFLGPTLEEAMLARNVLHVIAYIEGLILVGVLVYLLVENFKKLPVYNFIVIVFGTFWIMFPNYPFAIMNPGSAIRYRTGYIILIIFLFVVLGRPETYKRWRGWGTTKFAGSDNLQVEEKYQRDGEEGVNRTNGHTGNPISNNIDRPRNRS